MPPANCAACAANDPHAAYQALLLWFAAKQASEGWDDVESFLATRQNRELREQWQTLSQRLFAAPTSTTRWDGTPLWAAFRSARVTTADKLRSPQASPLPALNPD